MSDPLSPRTQPVGKLIELAKRCEQATGANKVLDEAIFEALAIVPSREHSFVYPYYAYTASIDAAMMLVPEEWRFAGSESMAGGFYTHLITRELVADGAKAHTEAHADSLALAISAAALRARSQSTPDILRSDD